VGPGGYPWVLMVGGLNCKVTFPVRQGSPDPWSEHRDRARRWMGWLAKRRRHKWLERRIKGKNL
jgi:hypothetical protein